MNPAERRRLGRTSLEVSALGFGGAALAGITSPDPWIDARDAVAAAWAAGVRYFDTAPFYGAGLSERRVGDGLRDLPEREWVLSTKIGRVMRPVAAGRPSTFFPRPLPFEAVYRYDYDGVMRAFEDSLQRLGLNRIDIALVHDLTDRHHPDPEVLEGHVRDLFQGGGYRALSELREQKVVAAIGAGLNSWAMCERLADAGDFDAFLLAGHYSLLDQTALTSFLPMCERRGIGVIMAKVYDTGVLVTGPVDGALYDYRPASEAILARTRRIAAVCGDFGCSLQAAALQFALHHPAVATVIPGMASPAQVEASVGFMREAVPADLYAALKHEGLLAADAPTGSIAASAKRAI